MLCTDNIRRLPGKADGSFHKCPPVGSKLAPVSFISLTKKKIVILKTPTKNHFLKKCLLLGRGNKMMHYTMDTFFFSFVKSLEKKLQAQGTKS